MPQIFINQFKLKNKIWKTIKIILMMQIWKLKFNKIKLQIKLLLANNLYCIKM